MNSFLMLPRVGYALLLLMMLSQIADAQPCREVIGYYPGWQWYDRSRLVNPETIDYSKLTIINYAFLYPEPDGTLTITDPWSDKNLLLGKINWATAPPGYDNSYDLGHPDYHQPGTSLIAHAHANQVKVMISIGGWTLSNDFPAIAADPTKRSNLAHWCNELIRVYDIDGVDVDWEYPGYPDHNGTPADKGNYSLLMKEIRDSLNYMESVSGKELLLTAAFGAAPDRMDDIEWDVISETLDYINLMSYDFFGAFSDLTNHNSPLYQPAEGEPTFNLDNAVDRLVNDHGVPREKITIGLAFYGRSAKTVGAPGLHVPVQVGQTDNGTFSADEGSPQYYNILEKKHLFEEHWDGIAQVPYLTGKDGLNTFVSYDDERAIGLKAQYVLDEQLAGVIIWEITGDYITTTPYSGVIAGTPLADTLNAVLCQRPTSVKTSSLDKIQLSPNPATNQINIQGYREAGVTAEVVDITGRTCFVESDLSSPISIAGLPPGVYILKIANAQQVASHRFIKQ